MAKLTLSDPADINNPSAATTIANNNSLIETAMENTLSRDGTLPNQMEANLDMNSNRITNLPEPASSTEPARLAEFNRLSSALLDDTVVFLGEPGVAVTDDDGIVEIITGADDLVLASNGVGSQPSFQDVNNLLDPQLKALKDLSAGANKLPYFTSSTEAALTDLSSFGRTLIDDADATAARETIYAARKDIAFVTLGNDSELLNERSLVTTAPINSADGGTTLTVSLSGTTAEFNTALEDGDFATLAGSETLTNKTISLGSNTVSGTTAQFNSALSDGDFATIAGSETLTNKTLTAPTLTGVSIAAPPVGTTPMRVGSAVSPGGSDFMPFTSYNYGSVPSGVSVQNIGLWGRSAGDGAFSSWAQWDTADARWEYPATSTYGSTLQTFNDNLTGAVAYYTAPSASVTAGNPITFTKRFEVGTGGTDVTIQPATATPAGGSTSARLLFGTTAGFGIYYGSGVPTVSAAQGSIYLRSDGSSTSTRLYINTDGGTTWTNVTTGA